MQVSVSSRTLKNCELPAFARAQEQAMLLPTYGAWLAWMRSRCSYALAVRLAIYAGFKVPCSGFYLMMQRMGGRQRKDLDSRIFQLDSSPNKLGTRNQGAEQVTRRNVEGKDCWGFRSVGGKESVAMYIMRAIEAGGKSKETILLEYRYDFGKSAGASETQSTFDVFLKDVQAPFGHAEQSRSLIILTALETGHLSLDPARAEISKNAVAKGILQRIRKLPGKFPPDTADAKKKDLKAIEAIREEFRVPLKK